MVDASNPEAYVAAALRRDIEQQEGYTQGLIGTEYDQVERDTLPFRGKASPSFYLAFVFWDSWIDASRHDWQYYPGIDRDDWVRLARDIIHCLENGINIEDPLLLDRFAP